MSRTTAATAGTCVRCGASYPSVAHFCARCGTDVRTKAIGDQRREAYAAEPSEPVRSFNVVSSLMPLAGRNARQTYRWALLIGLGVAAVAAAVGFLPFALAAAAVTVPVVYVLYLYDVNEWEDQPIPVLLGAIGLAGALAFGFTLLWRDVILDGTLASFRPLSSGFEVDTEVLLVVGLLVPIVSVLLAQIGPLWLVAFRRFDDLIDGLTFGVAAGATFAAIETLVLNSGLLLDAPARIDSPNAAVWVSIILAGGLFKPIVYGSAVGIACAAFSGKGAGHDGFTPSYARGLAEAIVATVAFQVGLYLTGRLGGDLGVVLGLVWTVIVAGLMVLRMRVVLHTALLEGALEAQAAGAVPASASRGIGYCGECELPLVHEASFCVACGASVRAAAKPRRRANSDAQGRARPATVTWTAGAPAETTRSASIMIIAAVAVVALVGGVAAAVNAGTRPDDSGPNRYESRGGGVANLIGLQGDDAAGELVAGPNGTQIAVPEGWEIQSQDEDQITLCTQNACFRVFSFAVGPDATAAEAMDSLINRVIFEETEDGEGEAGPLDPPVDTIVDAAVFDYQAIVATNDGSLPVDGHAEVFITEGGNFTSVDSMEAAGEFDTFVDDYSIIYNSVLDSLPA